MQFAWHASRICTSDAVFMVEQDGQNFDHFDMTGDEFVDSDEILAKIKKRLLTFAVPPEISGASDQD